MYILRLVLLLSLILSLSPCYSQSDTTRTYGKTQLQKIAQHLYKEKELDTLYTISKNQLSIKDTIIKNKDLEISNYKTISSQKEAIIALKVKKVDSLQLDLDKAGKQLKLAKTGLISLSTLSLILGAIVLIK